MDRATGILARIALALALAGAPLAGYAHALGHLLQRAAAESAGDASRPDKAHSEAACAECIAHAGATLGPPAASPITGLVLPEAVSPTPSERLAPARERFTPFASRAPPASVRL